VAEEKDHGILEVGEEHGIIEDRLDSQVIIVVVAEEGHVVPHLQLTSMTDRRIYYG